MVLVDSGQGRGRGVEKVEQRGGDEAALPDTRSNGERGRQGCAKTDLRIHAVV